MSVSETTCRARGEGLRNRMPWASRGRTLALALAVGLLAASPDAAHAYIGPGAGITVLGALWAVVVAIVLALAGLLAWPIRAMMRRRKQERVAAAKPLAAGDGDGGA
jgi:hypothetical protein